jgi:hypothetical protein
MKWKIFMLTTHHKKIIYVWNNLRQTNLLYTCNFYLPCSLLMLLWIEKACNPASFFFFSSHMYMGCLLMIQDKYYDDRPLLLLSWSFISFLQWWWYMNVVHTLIEHHVCFDLEIQSAGRLQSIWFNGIQDACIRCLYTPY